MKPRKLILSRKGFDSSSGGYPSPIFPNGTIYSLPIPGDDEEMVIRYGDLRLGPINIGEVVEDLTGGKTRAEDLAGLDPDIRRHAFPRRVGWRGIFGQTGASQTHLENSGVAPGDVFLFFGIFRKVEKSRNGWKFVRNALPQHIIWGWMQIGETGRADTMRRQEQWDWALYHCHFSWFGDSRNTLYVAANELDLGKRIAKPSAGVFSKADSNRILTEPGKAVSQWRLPPWFYPEGHRIPLTYHPDRTRWRRDSNYSYLRSVGRGQEFVLDLEQYPEGLNWISDIVSE